MSNRIFKSPYPSFNVPTNSSLSQFLQDYNPDNIDPESIIFEDFDAPHQFISYGGIRTAAAKGAAGLRSELGLQEGDVVAVVATNSVDWATLAQAVIWAGGTLCAINPVATPHELVHYLAVAEAKFIFTEADLAQKLEKALELSESMNVRPTVALLGSSVATSKQVKYKMFPADIINDNRVQLPPYDLSKRDNRRVPAVMCFSSGTSGKPKGVMLSHYNLIAYLLALRASDALLYNGFQREVFYASFSHIYGIFTVTLATFCGHFAVIMKRYHFQQYIKRCAEIRSTILRLVPATAVSMTKDPFVQTLDLTSVQTVMCSGAPLQAHVVQQLQALMNGTSIIQGYGLSETSVSILRGHWSVRKAGSVGRLIASTQVRIVDDDDNDVEAGEQGELLVKGPTVFMGYKNNIKETESSFKDGWFCTGDVVKIDSEGFLWLTDRKKELIKYKGNQVAPAELEDVLLSHPDVKEAAVCGVFDESQQTEIPIGYVNLQIQTSQEGLSNTLQAIKDFVDERVSPHKKLRGGVHFLAEIPRNINGKLVRRLLPAKVEAERQGRITPAKL